MHIRWQETWLGLKGNAQRRTEEDGRLSGGGGRLAKRDIGKHKGEKISRKETRKKFRRRDEVKKARSLWFSTKWAGGPT